MNFCRLSFSITSFIFYRCVIMLFLGALLTFCINEIKPNRMKARILCFRQNFSDIIFCADNWKIEQCRYSVWYIRFLTASNNFSRKKFMAWFCLIYLTGIKWNIQCISLFSESWSNESKNYEQFMNLLNVIYVFLGFFYWPWFSSFFVTQ